MARPVLTTSRAVTTASLGRLVTRVPATTRCLTSPALSAVRSSLALPSGASRPIGPLAFATPGRLFSATSRPAAPLSSDALETVSPAPLTEEQYHEVADEFLDNLLSKYEALQDERPDIDVEYSVSVYRPAPNRLFSLGRRRGRG
jgi:frataxin